MRRQPPYYVHATVAGGVVGGVAGVAVVLLLGLLLLRARRRRQPSGNASAGTMLANPKEVSAASAVLVAGLASFVLCAMARQLRDKEMPLSGWVCQACARS